MNSGRRARPHDSYLASDQVGVMDHAANPGRAIPPFSADPGHGHVREGVAPVGSDLRGRAAPSHRHDRRVTLQAVLRAQRRFGWTALNPTAGDTSRRSASLAPRAELCTHFRR